ncbi:hypothetical protein LOK49_LG11G00008 [Camellia lanceoleosa]|uniref:Uncharacterized protein n=1 Tax=Camellia lanceoleosa TaxID=1840588 RepID=A0ACC0FZK8_9ERIC|nr:hypothetical protein LOK49_LG11G00008 [Camellia lanceoleosa]
MNGGFGNDGFSRRITMGLRRGRSREGSGLGSAFHNLFFLGRFTSSFDDIVGIDFGTSTSRLAIMDAEVPTLLETERGQAIPSFVANDDEKKILVGQVANYHAIGYPADSFFNIKTLLGRKFHDSQIQELKTKVPYKINEGSNGEAWVEACNEQFSPTKLCAFIIDKMKRLAESYLGRSISKAVIAAPIYFNDAQKKELELAGKLAGLDVLGIVDEPFFLPRLQEHRWWYFCAFSLGGGTFNISILEISMELSRMMAKKAMLSGKMNVEKSALMQLKSVVEFKINRIEKMLNFWKKQIPRVYLRKYELDLAGIKKAMDLEDMLFLKSMLAEVEQLEGCLITLDPAYLIPDDCDDERY